MRGIARRGSQQLYTFRSRYQAERIHMSANLTTYSTGRTHSEHPLTTGVKHVVARSDHVMTLFFISNFLVNS